MAEELLLHEDPCSGNCYKIKLTAALLGTPLATKQYDIQRGETRTPEFLANVNAHGRIPVLQISDSGKPRFLPESNAACWYLARGSHLIPQSRFAEAEMLRWMFFEQYSHEPNIATSRFWRYIVGEANLSDDQRAQLPVKYAAGLDALQLMDGALRAQDFLAGSTVSLADIALFGYTHIAEEGGFPLADFTHICAWLERVKEQPNFVSMD